MYTVYYYPTCNTCKKALKWLETKGLAVDLKHIVEETPSKSVLQEILTKSGMPLKKLFNTSGMKYRELNMKEKQKKMSEEEILDLLASEGMLIKRPLIVGDEVALIGFREMDWEVKVH